jgi:RNA polymerase sigma factor (sigma-70 family)
VAVKHIAKNDGISSRQTPDNEAQNTNLVSEVGEAVSGLPPLEREVLIFSEYEGLELEEIAAIVGADVATVAARLGTARQRLRNVLAKPPSQ